MLTGKLDSMLGTIDAAGKKLLHQLVSAKEQIISDYENLDYASVMRQIALLADAANKYVEQNKPWDTIKTDAEKTRTVLTTILNAAKILTVYLKPVLPVFAEKIEKILNIAPLSFADIETVLENHKINEYIRLAERVDKDKVQAMLEESKNESAVAKAMADGQTGQVTLAEPIEPECTIDDFKKVDLRVAKVVKAEKVVGADKLLHLELDIGGITKNVFAGIAQAYVPEQLVGRLVICVANLQSRKMKFGISEGMILAGGSGGKDIFMLGIDSGAKPGQRIH